MNSVKQIATFNQLFNNHYESFVLFATGYTKDKAKAQDLVSDAFIKYWEMKEVVLKESNMAGYIFTIVKNNCINHLQHEKIKLRVHQELTDHAQWLLDTEISTLEACNPDKIFSEEIRQIIESTIDKLPPRTAQIFRMSRFEHLSHLEISKQIGLTTKSVEYHITKVLNELRVNLKDFLITLILLFFNFF